MKKNRKAEFSADLRSECRRTVLFSTLLLVLFTVLPAPASAGTWYQPSLTTTWQWQISGPIKTSYEADLYDIDLMDAPQEVIDELHRNGKKVICYFSAGSSENWRTDFHLFAAQDQGNPLDGWQGERWLDIRTANVMNIMLARLDLAAQKGCDGVEPDNVDAYTHSTGFPLTAANQLAYNRALADAAHARNLAVGLKNDIAQARQLVDSFDFSINEQCHLFNECDELSVFISKGKPVFNAEYATSTTEAADLSYPLCPKAWARHFQTLVLPGLLDGSFRLFCQGFSGQPNR